MTTAEAAAAPITIVPYDRARHGDGPWRVVSAVFEEYGFPFTESDYDADLVDPATHYDGVRGWFAVAEDERGQVVGCVGVTDEGGGLFELHRLYVLAEARRGGTGPPARGVGVRHRPRAWLPAHGALQRCPLRGCAPPRTSAVASAATASATPPTRSHRANGAFTRDMTTQEAS